LLEGQTSVTCSLGEYSYLTVRCKVALNRRARLVVTRCDYWFGSGECVLEHDYCQ